MQALLADPIGDLDVAVDRVAAAHVDHLPTHVLAAELIRIRRQVDRLEAQFVRRLRRFDRGHGAVAEGAVSTVSWLRGVCSLGGGEAVDRVRMSRALADLPEAMESFSAGRSPSANVSLLARLAESVGTEAVGTVEHTLVVAAEKLNPAQMRMLTAFTRHRLDADGALEEDNRNHERRWFACDQTFGGVFILRGELDAESGAIVRTALDALTAPRRPDDDRTGSQRRADALVDLAARQLSNGELPSVHGQRPHLTVTVAAETLTAVEGAPPAELVGVGPIHAQTARRLACDAVMRVATLSTDGLPLSIGRASRLIPPHMRSALSLRDRGCRFPGCDRPPEWTDGHHIRHWADHGATEVPNLVLLCRVHHRMVHEGAWQISLDADGEVSVTRPTGCTLGDRVAQSSQARARGGPA